jgi:predicted Zn finger-like uncharacterized protein
MILTCPGCRTRYRVDEQQLDRPAGRTVRCANCGHIWHHPAQVRRREPAPNPAALRAEPALEVPPRPGQGLGPTLEVPPRPAPAPTRLRRRRWRRLGWLALIVLLALAVLALYTRLLGYG